jgi:hypothetical protein
VEVNYTKKILAIVSIAIFAFSIIAVASPIRAAADTYGSNWHLNVLAPTPYQVVTGPYLAIHVQSINYRLDARYAGTPPIPDIGHYHEILDGHLIDMTPTTDPTHDQISMVDLADGLHTLTLVPAFNNHMMVMANAVNIPFYYEGPFLPEPTYNGPAGSPTISITWPPEGYIITGNSFYMTVSETNYLYCGTCYGKTLENNVGHWHIFAELPDMAKMGPEMPNMLTMAPSETQQVYVVGLSPGWYTFFAVLVQNNHMPFMVMNPDGTMSLQPGTYTGCTMYVSPQT